MRSRWGRASAGLLLLGLLGCGDDAPTDPGDGGGGPGPTLPFDMFEIALQPNAIERPAPGAPTPIPLVAEHALSVFARGGAVTGRFDWTVPASIGIVGPKTPQLSIHDYTVVLKLRDDGQLPLGMFTVGVRGESGTERDSLQAQFAVVQNTWMKHKRQTAGMFMADLTRSPVVYSPPGTPPGNDLIYYCEAPSGTTTTLRAIQANANLNGPEQDPQDVMLLPSEPAINNFNEASKTEPDLSPFGLGRSELLFSSTMDVAFATRCPSGTCDSNSRPPFNLWVVRREAIPFEPRPLTFDSTHVGPGGGTVFYAFSYATPRWDPSSTGSTARISFLTERDGVRNLWLADLVDRNGDQSSDTLVNYRQLTTHGVARYDWHPDGTRICVISGDGFGWVNSTTGQFTQITLPDSDLTRLDAVTVFAPPGQHTLVAIQAARENLSSLYVFDEVDGTLARVLPIPGSIDQPLQPRWHPRRKEIVYIGDYTVEAWANSSGGPGTPPDQLNPLTPELFGQRRTRFPSVWAVRFEAP